MSNEKYSVIVDGVRSPIVLKKSPLLGMRSDDLAAVVIKELVARNPGISKEVVDDLVVGCAFPEGPQGMLMAKGISILAELPTESAAKIVNRFCGSSMDAAHQVSQAVQSADYECGIAAGVEDMFSVPMGGFNPSFNPILYENEYYIGMGETAENLAQELDISRDDQEAFAVHSHEKALAAISAGRFDNEIVPIKFNSETVSEDEGPREPNLEKIKSLTPAFDADGSITAATSSPVSLGAASLLITSNTLAEESGVKAKFRIKSRGVAGVDWRVMGSGPLPATD